MNKQIKTFEWSAPSNDIHSFDPQLATIVGISAAILYNSICLILLDVHRQEANTHLGKTWHRFPIEAFAEAFPYFTKAMISYALAKLVKRKIILKKKFPSDRSAWYALENQEVLEVNAPKIGAPLIF